MPSSSFSFGQPLYVAGKGMVLVQPGFNSSGPNGHRVPLAMRAVVPLSEVMGEQGDMIRNEMLSRRSERAELAEEIAAARAAREARWAEKLEKEKLEKRSRRKTKKKRRGRRGRRQRLRERGQPNRPKWKIVSPTRHFVRLTTYRPVTSASTHH
jgi:hypothetical protein